MLYSYARNMCRVRLLLLRLHISGTNQFTINQLIVFIILENIIEHQPCVLFYRLACRKDRKPRKPAPIAVLFFHIIEIPYFMNYSIYNKTADCFYHFRKKYWISTLCPFSLPCRKDRKPRKPAPIAVLFFLKAGC